MIDLHMHTTFSDGSDEPLELLKKADAIGLNLISITDHNTVGAYEFLENTDAHGIFKGKILPGIELNTKIQGIPIEILGYGIDYKKIKNNLPKVYFDSSKRNKIEFERLYENCIKAGIKLDDDCAERFDTTGFASKFIINEILKYPENEQIISKDALTEPRIFYRKYMSNPSCPLYVEMDDMVPDFATAASLIKDAGGLVFMPHIFEYRENSRRVLDYVLENCEIDGIECFYTTFSDAQTKELLELCAKRNLFISGGSDYHGKNKVGFSLGIGYGNLKVEDGIISSWIRKCASKCINLG